MSGRFITPLILGCLVALSCAARLGSGGEVRDGTESRSRSDTQPTDDQFHEPTTEVLPGSGELEEWSLIDEPALYVGEALYDLIDGGAVQFFNHGFEWAAAAAYRREGDIGVEAYRMSSPESAMRVFEERASGLGESVGIGDDSRAIHTSVEFRKGSFFVLVTAYDTGQVGRDAAQELARIIEARLPAK